MGICNMKCGELYKSNNGEYFEILEFLDNRRIKVAFVKTGYVTTSTKQQILNGQVKDKYLPSVYGVGIVGTWDRVGKDREYDLWHRRNAASGYYRGVTLPESVFK